MATSESSNLSELGQLDVDGFTILPDVMSADEVCHLRAEIDTLERQMNLVPSGTRFEGRRTVRLPNLLRYSPGARLLAEHPLVLSLVEAYLGPDPLLSSMTSLSLLPGEDPQPLHVDDLAVDLPRPRAAMECTVMWALTDFTEFNGATRLVPGSHRLSEVPDIAADVEDPVGLVSTEMTAGSALIYHAGVWHGAGRNSSEEVRSAIGVSYCRGWMRTHENQFLALPVDLVRTFGPRLQKLCGYGIYRTVLGHVECREPLEPVRLGVW